MLSLVFFATWVDFTWHIHERLGAAGKLGIMGLVSALVTALGQRIERKKPTMLGMASGAVAGLVAVTPASGFVNPPGHVHL